MDEYGNINNIIITIGVICILNILISLYTFSVCLRIYKVFIEFREALMMGVKTVTDKNDEAWEQSKKEIDEYKQNVRTEKKVVDDV